jgi:putative ABC transport system ATP-binding protein
MEPIIKIQNLSVAYNLGKTNEVWALKDINLEIFPQEFVFFFGPSGCGKSTLLYVIAGLEKPTSGKVIVNGKDLALLSEEELIEFHRSSIGMIFQAYYLIPGLSAKDNILLPQIFARQPQEKRIKKARALMERFGIFDFQKRRPVLLSGGQQQRVAVARALINDPLIILADEPVGNLDSKNAQIVMNLLNELNQKDKKTVICVSHQPHFLHYANRVFYLKDGKLIRVVRNPEKPSLAVLPERKISELERLAQAYPYLTESRLRAKLILNHLLLPYGIEDQQKIEETIDKYLLKKITAQEMLEIFDLPPEKGGISLYTQTARDLVQKITSLAKEIEMIEEEKYPALTPIEEKAQALRGFLLDQYQGSLTFEQIKKLEEALSQRLTGKFDKKKFEKFLDLPLKQGGVGLNRRTAKRFARQIELILMKK